MDTMDEGAGKRRYSGDSVDEAQASRTRKRRQYNIAFKRQVVEETMPGQDSVSVVARRHDINTNLLFTWRKQYLAGKYDEEAGSSLIPIALTPTSKVPDLAGGTLQSRSGGGRLEIALSGGHRLVVEGTVDPAVLRTALDVLKG